MQSCVKSRIYSNFSLNYLFPEGNFGSLEGDYLLPEGNFGSLKKNLSLPEGNLGFLERDYLLPKGEMTLDKGLRSPHSKLNTTLHFDSHTFPGNCKLNSLLTSSHKSEDSCI